MWTCTHFYIIIIPIYCIHTSIVYVLTVLEPIHGFRLIKSFRLTSKYWKDQLGWGGAMSNLKSYYFVSAACCSSDTYINRYISYIML